MSTIFIRMLIHLIEPYNAWTKNSKKKHWVEIVEEESIFYKLMEGQQVSSQQIQDAATMAAGAGGTPPYSYFATNIFDFTPSPTSGIGPLDVTFTKNITNGAYNTYIWNFGDGTATSSLLSPVHTFTNTGSFTTALTASINGTNVINITGSSRTITVIAPTLTVGFAGFFNNGFATGIFFPTGNPITADFSSTVYNGKGNLYVTASWGTGSLYSYFVKTPSSSWAPLGPVTFANDTVTCSFALSITESSYNIKTSYAITYYVSNAQAA